MSQTKSYLIPDVEDDEDSFGRLLYFAAERGYLQTLKQAVTSLLKGVEDARNRNAHVGIDIATTLYTPLFLAAKEGHHECVQFLIGRGAAVEGSKSAWTPLWAATYAGHARCVEYLIEAGADLEGGSPETPIFIAAIHEQVGCLKLLCKAGANLNVQGKVHLFTPIHVLAVQGRADCVLLLAQTGADLELTDAHGDTPLLCATKYAKVNCMKVLLMCGANCHAICEELSSTGNNAMHIAASKSNVDSLVLLWKFGLNPLARNQANLKPSDMAVSPTSAAYLQVIEGKVRCLKDICRIHLRQTNSHSALLKLTQCVALPRSLVDYIFYRDCFNLDDLVL